VDFVPDAPFEKRSGGAIGRDQSERRPPHQRDEAVELGGADRQRDPDHQVGIDGADGLDRLDLRGDGGRRAQAGELSGEPGTTRAVAGDHEHARAGRGAAL